MSEQMQLEAQKRDRVGKGAARAARREGRVPAVIYGDKKEAVPISLAYTDILKQLHTGNFLTTVYNISVGGEKIMVIPKDFQLDVVKDTPMHVDFLRIAKGARVEVEVIVNFLNEETSVGLKKGGTLNIVRHTIELSCKPDNIPGQIDVDLAEVDVGDAIHISDVTIPTGSTLVETDRDFTVATIVAPGGEEEEAEVIVSTEATEETGGEGEDSGE